MDFHALADGAAHGVAAPGVQVAQQLVFLGRNIEQRRGVVRLQVVGLDQSGGLKDPRGVVGQDNIRFDLDREDAQLGPFDEVRVRRDDPGDVLDRRHVGSLDQVPELAEDRKGLLQDQVVARVIGRLVHQVQGLPAKVLFDLGEGFRLQEIAAVGVRRDVGIPVGNLFGRGKTGSEFSQGCGIQSLRYELRRHADMQRQVYRSAPCRRSGSGG
ncbi:hypothetical protein SRABI128_02370 [Microbacterium sp. Bi128]|nr:hypothetical protein SRABI128_02370 [Microbacterium sp. Bi128]